MPWTFGEPAFLNPFSLLKYLKDAPEGWECSYAKNCWPDHVSGHQWEDGKCNSANGKQPPAFYAKVIFRLDDKRME